MSYETEYYVLNRGGTARYYHEPIADAATDSVLYTSIELTESDSPFVFIEEPPVNRKRPPDTPSNIMFVSGQLPIVKMSVREKMLELGFPKGIAFNPTIFINHNGQRFEDYCLISVLQDMNYWDPEKSVYRKDSAIGPDGDQFYLDVSKVRLNESLLDSIPLKDRRIFQLSTVASGLIIHESIIDLFVSETSHTTLFAEHFNSFDED